MLKDADQAEARLVRLKHGEPVRVGDDEWVHDVHDENPANAFRISRLDEPSMHHVPVGIFRDVDKPTYDDEVRRQLSQSTQSAADLAALIRGRDAWTVA